MDDGWVLNDEYWEQTQYGDNSSGTDKDNSDTLAAQDASGVVTVSVSSEGEVISVKLDAEWKSTVEPHSLNASVIAAANSAIAKVMAKKAEEFDSEYAEQSTSAASGRQVEETSAVDESRITADDALRLAKAVTADLEDFMRQVSAVSEKPTNAESSGGHVSGSGQRGQVTEIKIDQDWVVSARDSEVEHEISDLLKNIQQRSSLGNLSKGPKSENIDELNALLSDPQKLLRRVGLTKDSGSVE